MSRSGNKMVESWCLTQPKHTHFRFTWRIANFIRYMQLRPCHVMKSGRFKTRTPVAMEWRLHLYPNGVDPDMQGFLSLFFHLVSAEIPDICVSVRLAILDRNGQQCCHHDSPKWCRLSYLTVNQSCWGVTKLAACEDIMYMRQMVLPGGAITLLCDGHVLGFTLQSCGPGTLPASPRITAAAVNLKSRAAESEREPKSAAPESRKEIPILDVYPPRIQVHFEDQAQSGVEGHRPKVLVPEGHLREDLGWLLRSENFFDVTIQCAEGKGFRAHKAILAIRCPRLWEMAAGDIINLPNIKAQVLAQVLRFIYTGLPGEVDPKNTELFQVARHLELDRLAAISEAAMVADIHMLSVSDYFQISNELDAPTLKREVIDFFRKNSQLHGTVWEELKEVTPEVIVEITEFRPEARESTRRQASVQDKDSGRSTLGKDSEGSRSKEVSGSSKEGEERRPLATKASEEVEVAASRKTRRSSLQESEKEAANQEARRKPEEEEGDPEEDSSAKKKDMSCYCKPYRK